MTSRQRTVIEQNPISAFAARSFIQTVRLPLIAVLSATCAWLAIASACADTIVDGRAIADEKQAANWLSVGRTYAESRFSQLNAVNAGNVRQLGLVWSLNLPDESSLQGTPIAVDGALYFSGSNGRVYAVDGNFGRELWKFDPDLGPVEILAAYADRDPEGGLRNILLGTDWLAAELERPGSGGPRPFAASAVRTLLSP